LFIGCLSWLKARTRQKCLLASIVCGKSCEDDLELEKYPETEVSAWRRAYGARGVWQVIGNADATMMTFKLSIKL